MQLGFEGGSTAGIIMAFITSARSAGIMCPRSTHKGCRGVTQMAILSRLNMRTMLSDRSHPVTG